MPNPTKKEFFARKGVMEVKEDEDSIIVKGYIATTHIDDGNDRITKQALDKWAKEINEGCPRSNKVSVNHKRISHPAGVGIKGTAMVHRLPDGEYGLYVETKIDKTRDDYEEIAYRIKEGFLDSFSIEYIADEDAPFSGRVRLLDHRTQLHGWTLASQPMNSHAVMIKELFGKESNVPEGRKLNKPFRLPKGSSKKFGVYVKDGDKIKKVTFGDPNMEIRRDDNEARASFMARHKCSTQKDKTSAAYWSCRMWETDFPMPKEKNGLEVEVKMEDDIKKKKKAEMTEEDEESSEETTEEEKKNKYKKKENTKMEGITISKEEKEILDRAISIQMKEAKKQEFMEFLNDPEFKENFMANSKKEVLLNNREEQIETKEKKLLVEFKELIDNKNLDVDTKFKEVGLIAEKAGLISRNGVDSLSYKTSKVVEPGMEFKNFRANGTKLEFKGLGITTNQNTDTDYLLSAAELRDMFDPVIYDAINLSTLTWNLLRKEDYSNKGNNQVQFTLLTAANSTASFYTGNSVTLGNSTRLKMQTKFKKVQVGIAVDGDMIAAARGGPVGDVFGQEVADSTYALTNVINKALFAEVGLETASAIIGFEYITDSAGNTTLYNLTRSTTNRLSPDSAGDTYINGSSARISLDNLRKAIEQAIKEGANISNLVFITHPTQERLFKGIYDASQRLIPTSSKFGFEGRPEFDAVPIFADKDCNTDDWFLVDLETHKVAMWMPPTLEMLGKRSDSEEGFIKMYFATYNRAPRRMVQIYGNATS